MEGNYILQIAIRDAKGVILSIRTYKADDQFDLDLLNWTEDKEALIREALAHE